MTEKWAYLLLLLGGLLLTTVAILSMDALGVRGVAISLGAIVPAVLTGGGVGWVVVHYDDSEHDGTRRSDR